MPPQSVIKNFPAAKKPKSLFVSRTAPSTTTSKHAIFPIAIALPELPTTGNNVRGIFSFRLVGVSGYKRAQIKLSRQGGLPKNWSFNVCGFDKRVFR